MPTVGVDTGVSLTYRRNGSGRPLVLVHGFAAQKDWWNYQILTLQERFDVITPDLRGHGQSQKPAAGMSVEALAADLAAFLRALALEDAVVVGHSLGGAVAALAAQHHNAESRIVRLGLVCALVPRLTRTGAEPYGLSAEAARRLLERARTAWPELVGDLYGRMFHRTDLPQTQGWLTAQAQNTPAFVAEPLLRSIVGMDLRDGLGALELPTLVLQGRHDAVLDPRWGEWTAAHLPQGALTWLEGSGHAPMLEEPDAVSEALAAFAAGA